jgi:glyoxylase-like metal-dependent hydrolase (beta-lactamase superfamily II)
MTELSYAVHVAPSLPTTVTDLPPDLDRRVWSPISATLIHGERDAVLVDPVMTIEQATALADWVQATGKNLTTVYVTHAHGDHWFGLGIVLDRFPGASAVAAPTVASNINKQLGSESIESFWGSRFPGQIPRPLVGVQELAGNRLELEGEELVVLDLGHTDTDDTTALHVPSIGLVVAGDAAYNDVHLYLSESDAAGRASWLAALDTLEALAPRSVVAGHKRAELPDEPAILDQTRRYLLDFEKALARTSTAVELYTEMTTLHPGRFNRGAVWGSARAAKG